MSDASALVGSGAGVSAGPSPLQSAGPSLLQSAGPSPCPLLTHDGCSTHGGVGGGDGDSDAGGGDSTRVSDSTGCSMLTIAALQQLKHQQACAHNTTTLPHAAAADGIGALHTSNDNTARQLAFASRTSSPSQHALAALRAPAIATAAAHSQPTHHNGQPNHEQQMSARCPTSQRSIASSHFSMEPDDGLLTDAMTHAWALTSGLTDKETHAEHRPSTIPAAEKHSGAQHRTLTLHADGSCSIDGRNNGVYSRDHAVEASPGLDTQRSDNAAQHDDDNAQHNDDNASMLQVRSAPLSARVAAGPIQYHELQHSTHEDARITRTHEDAKITASADGLQFGRRDMALQHLKERRTQALLLRRHVSASEAQITSGYMHGGDYDEKRRYARGGLK